MTPHECFRLAIRLTGLILLFRSVPILAQVCISFCNVAFFGSSTSFWDPLLLLGVHLGAAMWFFAGAPPVEGMALPGLQRERAPGERPEPRGSEGRREQGME